MQKDVHLAASAAPRSPPVAADRTGEPPRSGVSLRPLYLLVATVLVLLLLVLAAETSGLWGARPLVSSMERLISRDGVIENVGYKYAMIGLVSVWCLGLTLYFLAMFPTSGSLPRLVPATMYLIVAALVTCYLLDLTRLVPMPGYFYVEDGLFESMTALALLGGTALLLAAALVERRGLAERGFVACCALGAACLFFLAMEEISWGQRLIGWETGGFMLENNDQQEINLHNLVDETSWLPVAVFLFASLLVFSTTTVAGKWLTRLPAGIARFAALNEGYIYLAIVFVLLFNFNELFEEIFSIFSVYFGIDTLRAARHPRHLAPRA